ncbi:tyrosine-type recombinase/integrase [Aeromonas rivipollensis]|uniref:tyrosine-type recombinase/integrase n=1 Tax=Aeromonas rivipollensis TaxID=948519 RepID=UPI003D20D76F
MAISDSKLKAMLRGHDDDTPRKVADRDGLSVLWRNSGKVSFVYRYRILGKAKNLTLGSYTGQEGGLSLSEARKKAAQCRAWLEEGNDPALMTRIGKDERLKPVTVKDALEYWLCHHADKKRSNSEKHRQQFAKWVYPRIGDLPLSDCDTRHWLSVFDEYSKVAPVASGYCFQNCKHALKFCRVRQFAVSNALDDLTVADVGQKASKRDRVLTLEELRTLWEWAEKLGPYCYYGNLAKILLSFGARTQEARLSAPEEWNLVEGTWTVLRIPVKLNSDSGICEHHFRKVCGQGFFEQKLGFEGRHLFDSLNKPAAKRSAAVVDPRRWNRTVHLTSEYVL